MSRHEISARKPAEHKVIVGWDHPLMTFFIQVIDRTLEDAGADEKFVLWCGTNFQEIYEIDDLCRIARRFAEISAEIATTLYADKDEGR